MQAASLRNVEQYLHAFSRIAEKVNYKIFDENGKLKENFQFIYDLVYLLNWDISICLLKLIGEREKNSMDGIFVIKSVAFFKNKNTKLCP